MKKQIGRIIAVGGEETEWFSVRSWVVVQALTVLPGNLSAQMVSLHSFRSKNAIPLPLHHPAQACVRRRSSSTVPPESLLAQPASRPSHAERKAKQLAEALASSSPLLLPPQLCDVAALVRTAEKGWTFHTLR